MATENKTVAKTPPYVGYQSFKQNVLSLAHDKKLPPQIDHTVLGAMGGSTRMQFMGALSYLGLIDEAKRPTESLIGLVTSGFLSSELRRILEERYPEQIPHLANGTLKTLMDSFGDIGSIRHNATRFLIHAAKEAGLPIAAHISKARVGNPASSGKAKRSGEQQPPSVDVPPAPKQQSGSFLGALIEKFPAFDPSWDVEQQKAWLTTYEKLLGAAGVKETE